MSIHLPPPTIRTQVNNNDSDSHLESSTSDLSDGDQAWDDWITNSDDERECRSLFDDILLPSVDEALIYDKKFHNFSLNDVCKILSLDFHGRVRLINFIRRNRPTCAEVLALKGSEPWFDTDEYLVPVLENDPFIRLIDTDSTDSEDEDPDITNPDKRIKILERKLVRAQQGLIDYQALVVEKFDQTRDSHKIQEDPRSKPTRDDDTHYFESYEAHDIHATMIQDKVRTATYAKFILTNPDLFRDSVVLDVGCGTGILSLFAARAGARRVIAVEASQMATKADKIVKANAFEDVITVVRGKVEEVSLPEGIEQVDIILSEWMGYALLYESMLDSVLVARDRFLRPGGVMAPSQCQMMIGLCDATEVWKDRIGFWEDVYGFDLSTISEDLYDEAIVDVVGPETLLCKPYAVKDLVVADITHRSLEFATSFTLVSTAARRTKVTAFVLYFDTFFTPSGRPVPPSTQVDLVKEGEVALAELWPVGGKPAQKRRQSIGRKEKISSFSTGPQSSPTHWKQTIFMLREPFIVLEGSIVTGRFSCKKRENNSRELDVEIHYSNQEDDNAQPSETIVQIFKVR